MSASGYEPELCVCSNQTGSSKRVCSSTGRAAVSKTEGCGFDSFHARNRYNIVKADYQVLMDLVSSAFFIIFASESINKNQLMQLVKVVKKTKSKIEQAKTLLKIFCLLSEIKLSESELTVLAYFLVYKITQETKDLIIKSEIFNEDSLKNAISKLSRVGLIKKSAGRRKEYLINENINLTLDVKVGMLIQIDNS